MAKRTTVVVVVVAAAAAVVVAVTAVIAVIVMIMVLVVIVHGYKVQLTHAAAFIEKGDPDFGIESHLGFGAPHINALIPIITHIRIRDHIYIYVYMYIGEHT